MSHRRGTWPLLNGSSFQLLGLFQRTSNVSALDTLSVHSQAMFKAALLLSQQYNLTVGEQCLGWQIGISDGSLTSVISSTCRVMATSNIVGIIGPVFSREARVMADFGKAIGVPVVSFAATDPDLSDRNTYPAFYRTVPSDSTAAWSIAQLFVRFNWTSCIIIYQNDDFGYGGVKAVTRAFHKHGLIVSDSIIFNIAMGRIRGDLRTLLISSSTRLVILWAEQMYASLIIQNALDHDVLGPKFTWILRSSVPLNSFNANLYSKLIGLLTVEPTTGDSINTATNLTLLHAAYNLWQHYEPETFPGSEKVHYQALFAFDATWLLIQSLQHLCSGANNTSSCFSLTKSPFCFDQRFHCANALFDIVRDTKFLGVSGPIQFNENCTDRINGNYYLLQNVQPACNAIDYVPVLKWSDLDDWRPYLRTNVIVWPGNTLVPPTGRPTLKGERLRIGIIESHPFTMITEMIDESGRIRTKIIGYVPDLIDLLQKKMGFVPDIMLASANQTYAGLIEAVVNNVYDVVIGDVTITARRREKVGFSSAIFDNSLRAITRRNTAESVDLVAYLKPFSYGLWILLFITCLYAGILICILERQENEALRDRSIISSAAMSLWYSVGTIMGYGADFHAVTVGGRFLTLGLYFLSLVLVATYTAKLASDLTILKSVNFISGIDDIKNGKLQLNRIGIIVGSSDEDYFVREISGGNRNFYPLKSRKEMYDNLLNFIIDVSFMDSGSAEYITNNIFCNLTLIGADFDKGAFGVVAPKQWIYQQDLDVNILFLRESGALDELKRKWFQRSTCPDLSTTSDNTSIKTLSGLFLTFAVISVISLLLFAWKQRYAIRNYLQIRASRNVSAVTTDMTTKRKPIESEKVSKIADPTARAEVYFLA